MDKHFERYHDEALNMALTDFKEFCQMTGAKGLGLAVCIERAKGLTCGQISLKLEESIDKVKRSARKCNFKSK